VRQEKALSHTNTKLKFQGNQAGWVFAHNTKGENVWSFYASDSFIGVSPVPLEDEKFLYFLSGNGRLYSSCKESGQSSLDNFYRAKSFF
jgi:outer membrane protein assembly factor BamB